MKGLLIKEVNVLNVCKVWIGDDILKLFCADLVATVKAEAYVIVTDDNIAKLYLSELIAELREALAENHNQNVGDSFTVAVHSMSILPGEASKSYAVKKQVENFMFEKKVPRKSCMIALGGGVVGDLTGFIASTYMRGIPFVQVPTSILAMCDSSIGGKTGIDNKYGKNLIGTIYQPVRVYIDVRYLTSLPDREFRNGLSEVVKTAAIYNERDFAFLELYADEILMAKNPVFLAQLIASSVAVKAEVVNLDEREAGIREILNFGHTVGHAIETLMQPDMLHGEAVAIGMKVEAEMSRAQGILSQTDTSRLLALLKTYGFNTDIPAQLSPQTILSKMALDKKNSRSMVNVVLLQKIGAVYNNKSTPLKDNDYLLAMSEMVTIINSAYHSMQASSNPNDFIERNSPVCLSVPGSKSISNRALLMAAMAMGEVRLKGLLFSDDTQVMMEALTKIGVVLRRDPTSDDIIIVGSNGFTEIESVRDTNIVPELYLGNAGTASRFLTSALFSLPVGTDVIITGNKRMQERPISPLVDALRTNGLSLDYCNNPPTGCLPLKIQGNSGLNGGDVVLEADVSSQYVSSILIASGYAKNPTTLTLKEGKVVSQPYINMTIQLLEKLNVPVVSNIETQTYIIPNTGMINPVDWEIEGDASTASYPLAIAAITGQTVTVKNIGSNSLQGDANFYTLLTSMNCTGLQTETETTVTGPLNTNNLHPITIDMEEMTDTFMTAVVLAAVTPGTTTITGIANQRVKECNRILVMCTELAKLGVQTKELDDGLVVYGKPATEIIHGMNNKPVYIHCHDDHRIAMSFGVLACRIPNIVITEKHCVEKTYPEFWDMLHHVFKLNIAPSLPLSTQEYTDNSALNTKINNCYQKSIILVGMRGAGKSYLGHLLAKHLNYNFIDLDLALVKDRLFMPISDFVEKFGWAEFRKIEEAYFYETVKNKGSSNSINDSTGSQYYVFATGGGIIESKKACEFLEKTTSSIVLHLHRHKSENMAFLNEIKNSDPNRPSLISKDDDLEAIFNFREAKYVHVRHYVYPFSQTTPIQQFYNFIDSIKNAGVKRGKTITYLNMLNNNNHQSYFLSLTLNEYTHLDMLSMNEFIEGVHALELRIDMLSSLDSEFIMKQVAHVKAICQIPIIYTVRSISQNGQFDGSDAHYFSLIQLGVHLGCEIIDLEINRDLIHIQQLLQTKGSTASVFLISYHQHLKDVNCLSPLEFKDKFTQCYFNNLADLVKVVGVSHHFNDDLQKLNAGKKLFSKSISELVTPPPMIAILMKQSGVMSRVVNKFLSPITHSQLTVKAASGQLTIQELNNIKSLLGITSPKTFYLFGDNIEHSKSPAIHNSAFSYFNYPHNYKLMQCNSINDYKELLSCPNFGGASVTIPFKTDIIPLLSSVSRTAQSINAVNTVLKTNDGRLIGDNTDWIGIVKSLEAGLMSHEPLKLTNALIIGAGGTTRAAIFALKSMNVQNIMIVNRTSEKARVLSDEFSITHVALNDIESVCIDFDLIISTTPHQSESLIPPSFFHRSALTPLIVLDAAYISNNTKDNSIKCLALNKDNNCIYINGREMLIHQANAQFEHWTGHQFNVDKIRKSLDN